MKRNAFLALGLLVAAACGSKPAAAPPTHVAAAPVKAPPSAVRPLLSETEIDARLRAEWTKEKLTPTAKVDDAGFLRRVRLDITGTIPTPAEVKEFLADKSPDKRKNAVEKLLASPGYTEHFTNYFDRVLLGRDVRPNVVDRVAFRNWLREEFAKNAPYDKLVFELLTAKGLNSAGGNPLKPETQPAATDEPVNGATNWFLRYADAPMDMSGTASRIFLGVQIQCAQCHDHKTEKWKTTDFESFTSCFLRTKAAPVDRGKVMGVRRVDVVDVARTIKLPKQMEMPSLTNATPKALDGTDFSASPNRREALARWITAPQNPYFSQAIVNRMWAQFLGRGFADPVDDFRDSNPPILPDLLKRVSADFVASGYDLKHLIRVMTATEAYQLAPGPSSTDGNMDERLWAHFQITRLGPDELLDALVTATKLEPILERIAGDNLDQLRFQMRRQFAFLFDVDEESDHHDEFDGTITQALLLLNGRLVNGGATAFPGTALTEVLATPGGDEEKIRGLYLRTLSRDPRADEVTKWTAFVNAPRDVVTPASATAPAVPAGKNGGKKQNGGGHDPLNRLDNRMKAGGSADPKKQAYEDLFWALLNSSEFVFNH
ncbi:MAG: DUF1549 and DUF1553 domain-containing protein [Polyangiaceae bacterium]